MFLIIYCSLCLLQIMTDCSGQVGNEYAIGTSQNESILSRHEIVSQKGN